MNLYARSQCTTRKVSEECHNMAIFYRAVRNLVDFSLVTKLTKHVLKVRETVRKCEKTRGNDCETFLQIWRQTRKKWYRDFWIPIFVQNSRFHNQAGTLTRRWKFSIWKSFFGVSHVTSRICLIDTRRKSHFWLLLVKKRHPKTSEMTSWHPKSAKITPRGHNFAWKYARYVIFRCFQSGKL